MKGAVVNIPSHLDHFYEIDEPAIYEVQTPSGLATVTINENLFFISKDLGFEWYVVRTKTDQFVWVWICDKSGNLTICKDPLFECEFVARSPKSAESPSRNFTARRPMELGDKILMTGSSIASKNNAQRHTKGGSDPTLPPKT